jgi:hypothetical protein
MFISNTGTGSYFMPQKTGLAKTSFFLPILVFFCFIGLLGVIVIFFFNFLPITGKSIFCCL